MFSLRVEAGASHSPRLEWNAKGERLVWLCVLSSTGCAVLRRRRVRARHAYGILLHDIRDSSHAVMHAGQRGGGGCSSTVPQAFHVFMHTLIYLWMISVQLYTASNSGGVEDVRPDVRASGRPDKVIKVYSSTKPKHGPALSDTKKFS